MPVPLLDLQRQYRTIKDEIDREVMRVVAAQRFILGPDVEKFESEIANYTGSRHSIACASGTDALLLSLKALNLAPGAQVIAPSFTFFATAGAIANSGLKPVFVDVDPDTFNMTADTIAPHLSARTKAIVVVHLYGQMAEMDPIMKLADERGIAVIEDAAQSLGAKQHGRSAGRIGATGCYSYFPSKNLGGFGDGGHVVTDDDRLADRLRKLRVHGGRQMYHHEMVGTNSRLDALQAAVLSVKLPYLDKWAEARRQNAGFYDDAFRAMDAVTTPRALPSNHHVYNQYTLRVVRRDALKKHLDAAGIGNAIYYPLPLHLQECFADLGGKPGDLPVCERLAQEAISIPIFPELTDNERSEVVETILEFYN